MHKVQIGYCGRDPKAGDIIIFHPAAGALEEKQHFWEQDPVFIKRVVAVDGDVLEVRLPFTVFAAFNFGCTRLLVGVSD